jgi:hypothetical protein
MLQMPEHLILSRVVQIPVELEELFVVVEHELPGREKLADIARGAAVQAGELSEGVDFERVLNASAGLTRHEAERVYSLALVRSRKLELMTIREPKTANDRPRRRRATQVARRAN